MEYVIIGGGPWNKNLWAVLGLPLKIEVKDCQGHFHKDRDLWTYWRLAEAEARVIPERYLPAEGKYPPVIHVDSAEPLISDKLVRLSPTKYGESTGSATSMVCREARYPRIRALRRR